MRHSESNVMIPPPAMLDAWSSDKWSNGIQIDELKSLETVVVETRHHTYEITVIDPSTAEVLVRGGELFRERTAAHLSGASMGGSFLKLRGIYVGFKLELQTGLKRFTTSPVRSIRLCRTQ